jgi:hypothetical protein
VYTLPENSAYIIDMMRLFNDLGGGANGKFEAFTTPTDPLFRAQGIHTCWSEQAIGHTCFVQGASYGDCQEAFLDLKADDCCPGTQYGGSSVDFKITQCTPF